MSFVFLTILDKCDHGADLVGVWFLNVAGMTTDLGLLERDL